MNIYNQFIILGLHFIARDNKINFTVILFILQFVNIYIKLLLFWYVALDIKHALSLYNNDFEIASSDIEDLRFAGSSIEGKLEVKLYKYFIIGY